jgi:hypothetical protein
MYGTGDLTLMGRILPEDGGGVISTCAGGRHCAFSNAVDRSGPATIYKSRTSLAWGLGPRRCLALSAARATELPSMGCWLSTLSDVLDQFGDKVTEPLIRPIPYVSYFFRHDPARRD